MVLHMKLLVLMLQKFGYALGRPLHINETTKGLNVNLFIKPTWNAEKSLGGHELRFFNLSLVE